VTAVLRAALLLAALSACSSSPPGGDDGGQDAPGGDATEDAPPSDAAADAGADDSSASACIAAINHYRALVDAAPVTRKTDEEACAVDQATKGAADLADSGTTTFHKYFGQCSEAYQNECWYSVDDVAAVIQWCMDAFWAEGPPDSGINHYSVMVDPASTQVACGFARLDGGGYWMTNDFYP
jgi:hypothetical protein